MVREGRCGAGEGDGWFVIEGVPGTDGRMFLGGVGGGSTSSEYVEVMLKGWDVEDEVVRDVG